VSSFDISDSNKISIRTLNPEICQEEQKRTESERELIKEY